MRVEKILSNICIKIDGSLLYCVVYLMKKMLLLSYYFPPQNNGGIGRPQSIYTYLPEYGYDVTVCTGAPPSDLKKNCPTIVRLISSKWWNRGEYFNFEMPFKVNLLFSIDYTLKILGLIFDRDIVWENSVKNNWKKIRENGPFDVIYATYTSISNLRIGVQISQSEGVPLVVEFRDGLLFESVREMNFFQKRSLKKFEKYVIDNSDSIITVSKNISSYFEKTYNPRVYTIYNGYEATDFPNIDEKEERNDKKFKIAHFGSINASRARDVKPLFQALSILFEKGRISPTNFELALIGRFTKEEINIISDYGLSDLVAIYPLMDKKEGFKKLVVEYDALLFYGAPNVSSVISSKLLEYINLGLPILGICKGNEAADIISLTRTGIVSDFTAEDIYEKFTCLLSEDYKFDPDKECIKKFDRNQQTFEISKILDSLIQSQCPH